MTPGPRSDPTRLFTPSEPATVGWRETLRLIREDAATYGDWFPTLLGERPSWSWPLLLALRTESFGACLRFRLQIYLWSARLGPLRFRLLARGLAALNRVVSSVAIGCDVRIGGGLYIAHGHVIVHGRTTIGRRASLSPFSVLGLSNAHGMPYGAGGPMLGDDVFVGTGAKLLGPIRVGDRARIGANAVVIDDVPADHTAVGMPARCAPTKR